MQNEPVQKSAFGYRMEYPSEEEVRKFSRELDWHERLEVLSQGFHRGCYVEECYSITSLTRQIAKRNDRNPTGGVRTLDGDVLVKWIRETIGDTELAAVVERIFAGDEHMQAKVDTVRVVLTTRMNQYTEVLGELE